jgi:hypothetical protein
MYGEGIKIHYVHRIVIMQTVGVMHSSAVQTILGAEEGEESAGHEGEGAAAKRLIKKMIGFYGSRFFDVFTTDALYTNKPFVLFVDSLGKYLVSRVKREDTTVYQEEDIYQGRDISLYVNPP